MGQMTKIGVLLMGLATAGACQSPSSVPVTDTTGEDRRDSTAVSDADVGSGMDADARRGDTVFRKPDVAHSYPRNFDDKPVDSDSDRVRRIAVWTRDYTPNPDGQGTVWLYRGEYFSVDGRMEIGGTKMPASRTVEVLVLVDFRPVPFAFEHIEEPGGWIPRSDFSELEYREHWSLTVRKSQPYNFTVVVPPSSLGARGAHDVRVVFLNDVEPDPDGYAASQPIDFPSAAYTLYYGGYDFVQPVRPHPTATNVHPEGHFRVHLHVLDDIMITPRSQRMKLQREYRLAKFNFGRVFRPTSSPFHLEATAAGADWFGKPGDTYLLVLDGLEPLERYSGEVSVGKGAAAYDSGDVEYAARFQMPLRVPTGERRAIRAIKLPEPNTDWRETEVTGSGISSNVIFIERSK